MGNEHGNIHWNELNTRDPVKAAEFYKSTLGLSVQEADMGEAEPYRLLFRGEEMVGGIFAMSGPDFEGAPNHWFTYFAVSDADKAVKDVSAAGGKVHKGPFDVPDVGRIVVVEDSTGAMCGFIQPAPQG